MRRLDRFSRLSSSVRRWGHASLESSSRGGDFDSRLMQAFLLWPLAWQRYRSVRISWDWFAFFATEPVSAFQFRLPTCSLRQSIRNAGGLRSVGLIFPGASAQLLVLLS